MPPAGVPGPRLETSGAKSTHEHFSRRQLRSPIQGARSEKAEMTGGTLRPNRIVVVDDNRFTRELARETLEGQARI